MYDHEDEDESSRSVQALKLLMAKVHELGGAISGEHGIGLAKTPFARMQFKYAEWKTMKAIKEDSFRVTKCFPPTTNDQSSDSLSSEKPASLSKLLISLTA